MVLAGRLELPSVGLRGPRSTLELREDGAATRDRTVTCRLPSDRAHLAHRSGLSRWRGTSPHQRYSSTMGFSRDMALTASSRGDSPSNLQRSLTKGFGATPGSRTL